MPDTDAAGATELTAVNVGQAPHEMLMVRAPASGALPLDQDGAVDGPIVESHYAFGMVDLFSVTAH